MAELRDVTEAQARLMSDPDDFWALMFLLCYEMMEPAEQDAR